MSHESISDERIWRVLTKAQDDLDWCRLQLTPPPRPFPLRIDPETGQFVGPTPEEVEAAYPPPPETIWPARQESGPMAHRYYRREGDGFVECVEASPHRETLEALGELYRWPGDPL